LLPANYIASLSTEIFLENILNDPRFHSSEKKLMKEIWRDLQVDVCSRKVPKRILMIPKMKNKFGMKRRNEKKRGRKFDLVCMKGMESLQLLNPRLRTIISQMGNCLFIQCFHFSVRANPIGSCLVVDDSKQSSQHLTSVAR